MILPVTVIASVKNKGGFFSLSAPQSSKGRLRDINQLSPNFSSMRV
jgi:hypothetical protein